ncbi:MAG: hypothetical protein HZA53_16190 [Planctomycetes bacterium]|nr:hypothetical protein [Planctomycetota bacterium]
MNAAFRSALGLTLIMAGSARASSAQADADTPPSCVTSAWHVLTRADGLPDQDVTALRFFDGSLWVGTRSCLARLEQGCWTRWGAESGLPDSAILSIDVDPATRDVWLGTLGGGLWRMSAGRLDRFDQFQSGLAGDVVFTVRVIGPRVWAATNGGLCAFDWVHGTWDLHLERRAHSPETVVRAIEPAPDGVFAVGWEEGLWRIEDRDHGGERLVPLPELEPVGLSFALGRAWVGGAARAWRSEAKEAWRARDVPAPLPGAAACFTVSDTGRIWFGSSRSLWLLTDFESGEWYRFDFGTQESGEASAVHRVREGADALVPGLPGLPSAGELRCLAAVGDELWAGTSRGLLHASSAVRGAAHACSAPVSPAPMAKPTETLPSPTYVAVLGPFLRRTVALPGDAGGVNRHMRVDPSAADAAFRAHAASRSSGGRPPVVVQSEFLGLSPYAWGTPEDEVITQRRKHEPVAWIGTIEPGDRVACALSLLEERPWIDPALTEPAPEELASPWIFRCPSQDPLRQRRLLERCFAELACKRPLLLRDGDPYDDLHVEWWKSAAEQRGTPVVAELQLSEVLKVPGALESLSQAHGFDVVLCWTDATASGELVRYMRARGLEQPVLASDAVVSSVFLERAGGAPGRVLAPRPCPHREHENGGASAAGHRYAADGMQTAMAQASTTYRAVYAATGHLLDALNRSGPNRMELRRNLEERRELELVRLEGGRWR